MGYILLNKKRFFKNLDYISKLCGSSSKISLALKDNAYGHGIKQIASMAQEYGIKHTFVRNLEEVKQIKKYNFSTILVLYDIPKIKDDSIIIAINSLKDIKKIPKYSKVELKLDTGMNRNGIVKSELTKAIKLIKKHHLRLFGVFTHFCCSDESNNIIYEQEKKFLSLVKQIKKEFKGFRIHCANSSAIHKIDNSKYDIVRVGLAAYGYVELDKIKILNPVLSLWAKKIATKTIKKNQHIGYGSGAFIANKTIKISNYDIGYGDGFFRFSEHKPCTIKNNKKILGRVSMDSLSIESTKKKICIFDNAYNIAKANNTIVYEVLASLNKTIKRKIIK